jgi:hypothetical protein
VGFVSNLLFHLSPNFDFFLEESSSSSLVVLLFLVGLGVTGLLGVSGLGLPSKSELTGMIFLRPAGVS